MAEKKTEKKTTKKEPAVKKTTTKKKDVVPAQKTSSSKTKAVKPTKEKEELKIEEKALPKLEMPELIGEKNEEDDFVFDESKYDENSNQYFEATGRRKTAVARVRLYTKGDKTITINGKDISEYFKTPVLQKTIGYSLDRMKSTGRFRITIVVKGGGINSQAEAIRHGITRALVVFNPEYRKRLRKAGFLTRDSRMKERKKFGLKRARRAPQWSKR